MPDDYYKGVGTLAPTNGIKDPQVRAFCDSLANVWELRNGNTGSDRKQRFITEEEWDFLAKNPNIRAIAGVGQPGSATQEPGPGGSGGNPDLPSWLQNLVDFLASGITLIDFSEIYRRNNELFANYFAITTEIRNAFAGINEELAKLQNDITQINTITHDSESDSAKAVYAIKEKSDKAEADIIQINYVNINSTSANAQQTAALIASVNDPTTGNIANTAAIIAINTVTADSSSANARELAGLFAQTNDPVTGLPRATADITQINTVTTTSGSAIARTVAGMSAQVGNNLALINEINNVAATSTSASARKLSGVIAYSGLKARVFAQSFPPVSDASYTLIPGDLWINTANSNVMYIWNGAAWVDASDARISSVSAAVVNETNVRTQSDSALASQLNYLWAQVGNSNALVWDVGAVYANTGVGQATQFKQVQASVTDPNTGAVYTAANNQTFYNYVNYFEWRASSYYSLKVEAQAGGVIAATGMILSAEVNQGQPQSAVVFRADRFAIYHPNYPAGGYIYPPFLVSDGVVRMNVAWINDRIQSDNFVSSFDIYGNYVGPGTGWVIRQNGNSEFHGASLFGRMYTGSVMIDRQTGQIVGATAVGSWTSQAQNGANIISNSGLVFWGPYYHGYTGDPFHRLRDSDNNGVNLPFTVQFMGVADHFVSLWLYHPNYGWQNLNTTTTPSNDYGACTCGFSGTLPGPGYYGYWQFGVSATNNNMAMFNSGKPELRDFTVTVTIGNL